MDIVYSASNFEIYWHDTAHTILVVHLFDRWNWSDIQNAIHQHNTIIEKQIQFNKVYGIGVVSANALLPDKANHIPKILELVTNDPFHEELMIFVMQKRLFFQLIKLTMDMYRHVVGEKRYLFVDTFEEALQIIEDHKLTSLENSPSPQNR